MPQVLNPRHPVLYEEELRHLRLSLQSLNMLDIVKRKVEGGEVVEVFEAVDVGNGVIVEVKFFEGGGQGGEAFDIEDAILAEAKVTEGEAGEVQGGDGSDAEVDEVKFGCGGGVVGEEVWRRASVIQVH